MRRLIWASGSAVVLSASLALAALTQSTSDNWGGYADLGSAEHYSKVKSSWIQPTVTCNPNISGYQWTVWWVGIDGWGSNDVLQAGTETQITQVLWFTITSVYTWWEWFPAGEVAITNLPVSPGDVMYCLICADSPTHATVSFSNQSQGVGTRFDITPPAGTTLVIFSAKVTSAALSPWASMRYASDAAMRAASRYFDGRFPPA